MLTTRPPFRLVTGEGTGGVKSSVPRLPAAAVVLVLVLVGADTPAVDAVDTMATEAAAGDAGRPGGVFAEPAGLPPP